MLPKTDAIEERVQEIRQHTVVAFFGISMVLCMVARRLEQPNTLQEVDERAVFRGRAMSPFVNLIGV